MLACFASSVQERRSESRRAGKSYVDSVMIKRMRDRIYNHIPVSTLAAAIATALVLNFLFPLREFLLFPYKLAGLFMIILGLYLGYLSIRQLVSHRTTYKVGENPSSLVMECPYRYSRNPIYLGLLLVVAGTAISLSSITALIAPLIFFITVNTLVIPFEEKRLSRNFGAEYENYKKSVRRWI